MVANQSKYMDNNTYQHKGINLGNKKTVNLLIRSTVICYGVPNTSRTCDPHLRRVVLYPAELLGQLIMNINYSTMFIIKIQFLLFKNPCFYVWINLFLFLVFLLISFLFLLVSFPNGLKQIKPHALK